MKTLETIQRFSRLGRTLSKAAFVLAVIGFCGCVLGIFSLALGSDGAIHWGGVTIHGILTGVEELGSVRAALGRLAHSLRRGGCAGEVRGAILPERAHDRDALHPGGSRRAAAAGHSEPGPPRWLRRRGVHGGGHRGRIFRGSPGDRRGPLAGRQRRDRPGCDVPGAVAALPLWRGASRGIPGRNAFPVSAALAAGKEKPSVSRGNRRFFDGDHR